MRNPVRTADSLDISVGVTVDLELSESAGGHVKCWQRLAEAATSFRSIDLTVYFLGAKEEVIALSDRVRYRTVVPRRATRSIGIRSTPGHTDIAQRNAKIETLLPAHDVLHMTGPFALSGSAQWTSTIMKKPLAASIHTDNAAYARLCTAGIVADYFGGNRIIRAACERLGLSRLSERAMTRREVKRWSGADHIFYSNESQQLCLRSRFGETPRSRLRLGVDSVLFTPKARDRARMQRTFGVPIREPIVAFVGRLDATKNVLQLVSAAEKVWESGVVFRLLMVGDGPLRSQILRRCGERALMPGWVSQRVLPWMLASADIMAFPSETETVGSVVLEAMASGVPVMVPDNTSGAEAVRRFGNRGIVIKGRTLEAWVVALSSLVSDPAQLSRLQLSSLNDVNTLPTWSDVFREDLLPVWRRLSMNELWTDNLDRVVDRFEAAAT